MTLELVAPDPPSEDPLDDRIARLAELIDYLKSDLDESREILQRLLDYLDIDRGELEYFKQTGRLRTYPGGRVLAQIRVEQQIARQAENAHEELAEQIEKRDAAVERLDELIVGIEAVDPLYKDS